MSSSRAGSASGRPGVGKGTQAQALMAAFGDPADLDRRPAARALGRAHELGLPAKELMDAGKLVPDDVVNGMVADRLARPDTARGYILDGFPRTQAQAKWLDGKLPELHDTAASGRDQDPRG